MTLSDSECFFLRAICIKELIVMLVTSFLVIVLWKRKGCHIDKINPSQSSVEFPVVSNFKRFLT